ncbi:MAG: TAXI family TRAP transporter solute-binding subunit, partial [Alphaproteobacteria bacterium]
MGTTRRHCLALAIGAALVTSAKAAEPTVVSLGTATPGGGFPLYGEAFAAAINASDSTLAITPRNTRGSSENVPLLESGALDLALVQGEAAYEALNGIGRSKADLRILSAMYSSPGMFAVRADSPAQTISDLVGKPVAFGAAGSGLVILARYVLDGIGLDMNR